MVLVVLLLVVAVAAAAVPARRRDVEQGPATVAYLRRGARFAVAVALLALHVRGAVGPTGRGLVRTSRTRSTTSDPLERAVYHALYEPLGVSTIRAQPRVRAELAGLRQRLVRAGLLLPAWRRLTCVVAAGTAVVLCVVDVAAGGPVAGYVAPAVAGLVLMTARRTVAGWRAVRRHRADTGLPMRVAVRGFRAVPGTPAYLRVRGPRDGREFADVAIGPNPYIRGR